MILIIKNKKHRSKSHIYDRYKIARSIPKEVYIFKILLVLIYSEFSVDKKWIHWSLPDLANPSLWKNRLCSKCTNLYRTPVRAPARKSIFQYPAYFGLLAAKYTFQYPFPVERVIFFFSAAFCNSLSGISVRMKRIYAPNASPLRYNNVFFVACLPHCAGTDPLSVSPLSLLAAPLPPLRGRGKKKEKIHCSALFHFPVPALRQLLLIWKSKEYPRHSTDLSRWLFMKRDYSSGAILLSLGFLFLPIFIVDIVNFDWTNLRKCTMRNTNYTLKKKEVYARDIRCCEELKVSRFQTRKIR